MRVILFAALGCYVWFLIARFRETSRRIRRAPDESQAYDLTTYEASPFSRRSPQPIGVDDWGQPDPTPDTDVDWAEFDATARHFDIAPPTEAERDEIRQYLDQHGDRIRTSLFDEIRRITKEQS